MAAAVRLREDFDAATLRGLAKASHDPDQLCRLLSLAEIYDDGSRGDAARIGSVGLRFPAADQLPADPSIGGYQEAILRVSAAAICMSLSRCFC